MAEEKNNGKLQRKLTRNIGSKGASSPSGGIRRSYEADGTKIIVKEKRKFTIPTSEDIARKKEEEAEKKRLEEESRLRAKAEAEKREAEARARAEARKKLTEEAAESWMAAEYEGNERTAEERSRLVRIRETRVVGRVHARQERERSRGAGRTRQRDVCAGGQLDRSHAPGTVADRERHAVLQIERAVAFGMVGNGQAACDFETRAVRNGHVARAELSVRREAHRAPIHRGATRIGLLVAGLVVEGVRHNKRARARLADDAAARHATAACHRLARRHVERKDEARGDVEAPVVLVPGTEDAENVEVVGCRHCRVRVDAQRIVARHAAESARADDQVGDEKRACGAARLRDSPRLDRADVAAPPETEDGRTAPRGRLHDHFPACLQVAVDVDVAPVKSVRDAGEVGFSAFLHAKDAVVAGLRAGEALAVHGGAVGDDPRFVAHVVDRPVRREREVAVERARPVRAAGRAQRVVGIGGRRAAGELHRPVLRHVVGPGKPHGIRSPWMITGLP